MPVPAGGSTVVAWATAADVAMYTGAAVDDATLGQAQGVIDLFSNVSIAASGMQITRRRSRNLRLLKMATAYQAAWMASQPDVMGRMDITAVNQDGMQFTPAQRDALVLAPLAQRCLARLSWRRTQSVPIGHPDDRFRRRKDWTAWREAQDVRGYPELGPAGELPYEGVADDGVGAEHGSWDDGTHGWEPM